MTPSLLFTIALFMPFAAAVASYAFESRRGNVLSNALLAFGGAVGLLGCALYFIGDFWSPAALPLVGVLGALFVANDLNVFFIALISLGVVLTSSYSVWYLEHYAALYSLRTLNLATAVFIVAMQACALSTSVFSFLMFWELMSVSVYFLVIADRSEASLDAGFLYFVMAHIGFVSLLAGFLILAGGDVYASFGTLAVHAASLSPTALSAAFILFCIGFGSKAGLVPFHRWLPAAHPAAPSGSSALLSGVMLKMAVFGFVQAMLFFPVLPLWYAIVVFVFGLLTAFFGALYAAVESDLKRLLAWSSIENMGLIFSGLGALGVVLALQPSELSHALISGLVYFTVVHILSHSLFKTGLFMAAGAIVTATHTRDMDQMGGLARQYPWLSIIFLVLALSAVALPPFVTFYGEWSYVSSLALALQSTDAWLAVGAGLALALVALVAGLALFAFVKAFSAVFLGRGRSEQHNEPLDWHLLAPITVSAVLVSVLGFFAAPLAALIFGSLDMQDAWHAPLSVSAGASVYPIALVLLLCMGVATSYLVWRFAAARSSIRITDTWDCGQPLTRRMEYTASGFAAPIRFFFRGLVVSEKMLAAVPVVAENVWIVQRTLTWDVTSFWARWLYQPIGWGVFRIAHFVRKLQNGRIQFYLLLVFGALIGVIVAAL